METIITKKESAALSDLHLLLPVICLRRHSQIPTCTGRLLKPLAYKTYESISPRGDFVQI